MKLRYVTACLLIVWVSAALADGLHYRPGCWVEVQAPPAGTIPAPGTATVAEAGRAEAQYVLPMAAPWAASVGGETIDVTGLPDAAWLVLELGEGRSAARQGLLKALPIGSAVLPAGDMRRGVPESVDLLVCYEFSEGSLQPQERRAIRTFVRRGGAALFVFGSRVIPAASVDLWRDLLGAAGSPERQAPGLPRGFLVPSDFRLSWDSDAPRLRWARCGRGVTLVYGLAPGGKVLQDAAQAADLFARIVRHAKAHRRPLSIGPIEPKVFGLFGPPGWSAAARRRHALLAGAYAAAAVGLLLSFGAALARSRRRWLAGAACLALAGWGAAHAFTAGQSGLALDVASLVFKDPGTDPAELVFARVTRLGPGRAPVCRSADPMPPKLLLYSRFSVDMQNWVNYRFRPGRATVQPLLKMGQSICFVAARTLSEREWRALRAGAGPTGGTEPDPLADLFKVRWAEEGVACSFSRAPTRNAARLFDVSADRQFVQVRRRAPLVVTRQGEPGTPASTPSP